MANAVDPLRHLSIFDPEGFGERRVDIIGCGATGSRIALEVAKLGVQNLHLHDFDKIEEHNIANQAFGIEDIGRPKVEALAELILRQTGLECVVHDEAVTGRTILGQYVFLLTDTMASRKEIWEGAIRYKPSVECMIETRMGASEGRVYLVNPVDPSEIELWESTLCEDDEASDSLCGARTTVGPTAALVQAHAVWGMIRAFNYAQRKADAACPEIESIFYADPPFVMNREVPSSAALI